MLVFFWPLHKSPHKKPQRSHITIEIGDGIKSHSLAKSDCFVASLRTMTSIKTLRPNPTLLRCHPTGIGDVEGFMI